MVIAVPAASPATRRAPHAPRFHCAGSSVSATSGDSGAADSAFTACAAGFTAPNDLTLQFVPNTPTASLGLENAPASNRDVNFNVEDDTVTSGTITSTPGGRAAVFDAIDRLAFSEVWSGDFDLPWVWRQTH